MNESNSMVTEDEPESTVLKKAKLDGILLGYMARRLQLTLDQLEKSGGLRRNLPLIYHVQERRRQMHRIAFYHPEYLLTQAPLAFVGFLSARQKPLRPSILNAIKRTDKRLVMELANAPGILSYSSLELRNGDWCNLVVLTDAGAKRQITGSQTHYYAAYMLAQTYYAWIRLHSGVMPVGLDHMEMRLLKTKYYTFHPGQPKPAIQELAYAWPSEAEEKSMALDAENSAAYPGSPFAEPPREQED
jgi:hypothetical protein